MSDVKILRHAFKHLNIFKNLLIKIIKMKIIKN
jgi:hypothetical protein